MIIIALDNAARTAKIIECKPEPRICSACIFSPLCAKKISPAEKGFLSGVAKGKFPQDFCN